MTEVSTRDGWRTASADTHNQRFRRAIFVVLGMVDRLASQTRQGSGRVEDTKDTESVLRDSDAELEIKRHGA